MRPAALHQGCLFEPPRRLTFEEVVAAARAYVASVLRRRVCVECCEEDGLQFLHRRRHVMDLPIARLVQAGASRVRLAEEIAKCDVVCPRCKAGMLSRRRWRHHQMLLLHFGASIGVVAKARTTTGRGETARWKRQAKADGKPRVSHRVA